MRTTLEIDDDLMAAAKQLAGQRGTTIGVVVSSLMRAALEPKNAPKVRNGALLFEARRGGKKPSMRLVNELRDES